MSIVIQFNPIGFLRNAPRDKREVARQSALQNTHENESFIEVTLENAKQTLIGVEGFSHLWVIFNFDRNTNWNPMVLPPRLDHKTGVFASRSPHRPNPIGISLCEISKIKEHRIYLVKSDLLEGTPILDLKPYIPEYDYVSEAKVGWTSLSLSYYVTISQLAETQFVYLKSKFSLDLKSVFIRQLEHHPLDNSRKRVKTLPDKPAHFEIAFRTWRAEFVLRDEKALEILNIYSGYSPMELASETDKYNDKNIHRAFVTQF